ncbi:MAG: hypothetical protein AAF843_20860, partial [Bacteroidota bacterium]
MIKLLALASLVWQCQINKAQEKPQEIYFEGDIVNGSTGSLTLFLPLDYEKVPLENGHFSKTINAVRPQIGFTSFNRNRCVFFAKPGDSIHVKMDSTGLKDHPLSPLLRMNLYIRLFWTLLRTRVLRPIDMN